MPGDSVSTAHSDQAIWPDFAASAKWLARCAVAVCLPFGWLIGVCSAKDYVESFDAGAVAWRVASPNGGRRPADLRLQQQRLDVRNLSVEYASVALGRDGVSLQLEHPLPASRVFDELELTLRLHSNQAGAILGLRIVFPNQTDPNTGQILVDVIDGDEYAVAREWQELRCGTTSKAIERRLQLIRARLGTNVDTRGLYVDRAIVKFRAGRGPTEFAFDELRLGPLVAVSSESSVVPVQHLDPASQPSAEFRLDRLYVGGRPFVLRAVPYHGESLDALAAMGVNTAWIPNYQDTELLQQIRDRKMWAMATPPRAEAVGDSTSSRPARGSSNESPPAAAVIDPEDVSLAPFGPDTAPILFWNLGTRISADVKPALVNWVEQVRNADHKFNRPILADVAGLERVYSSHVSMLGVSRNVLHSGFGFRQYRQWLVEKQNQAQPGSPLWTWVPTEPTLATIESRAAAGRTPIVVEPEQLRLLTYSALACGYRGIGFWSQTRFDDDQPGNLDRRLALAELNMELELLEPFLATGSVLQHIPFTANSRDPGGSNQLAIEFGGSKVTEKKRLERLNAVTDRNRDVARRPGELEATLIQSPLGWLLLPVWYEEHAQFVPGQMAAEDATIIVPGVPETVRAWEVSSVGVTELRGERVTRGYRIVLPKFDTTSIVIMLPNADSQRIEELRRKIESLRSRSARLRLDLARAKFSRVRDVNRRLTSLGFGLPDGPAIMGRVQHLLEEAQARFDRTNYTSSWQAASACLQMLRVLQRAHWNDTVRKLRSPVYSPHAICFQTLPDHWELVSRLGQSSLKSNVNLLPSGDFENIDAMLADGWRHEQRTSGIIRTAGELYPRPHCGTHCLRLVAVPETNHDVPSVVTERPITVTSPPIQVRAGQIIHISGFVRVAAPCVGNLDGAMLYDSLVGQTGALRWQANSDWQPFELLREAAADGEFTLTLTLTGLGEILFDDLKVVAGNPEATTASASEEQPIDKRSPRASPLNFLPRLPGWGNKRPNPDPAASDSKRNVAPKR